jgi:hypothetical protein
VAPSKPSGACPHPSQSKIRRGPTRPAQCGSAWAEVQQVTAGPGSRGTRVARSMYCCRFAQLHEQQLDGLTAAVVGRVRTDVSPGPPSAPSCVSAKTPPAATTPRGTSCGASRASTAPRRYSPHSPASSTALPRMPSHLRRKPPAGTSRVSPATQEGKAPINPPRSNHPERRTTV